MLSVFFEEEIQNFWYLPCHCIAVPLTHEK